MERSHEQAQLQYTKFSYALGQLQRTLRPVLSAIDALRSAGNEEDLDPMSRARMHISLAYAVNSLFCMYLRTQGIDPLTHPVAEEIARVQDAFMRMRKVEAGESTEHKPKPDRDRRKHIVNAKRSSARLAALVFPEEEDLLRALQGIPGRLESKRGEKSASHVENEELESEKHSAANTLTRPEEESSRDEDNEHATFNEVVDFNSGDDDESGTGAEDNKDETAAELEKSEKQPESTPPASEKPTEKKKIKKDKKEKERKKKKDKKSKDYKEKDGTEQNKNSTKSKKRKSKSDLSSGDKREKKRKKRDKEKRG